MARLIADAGLLIAAEKNDRRAWALKKLTTDGSLEIDVPAVVVAQCWRGARSVNLARFLTGLPVIVMTDDRARRAGALLGTCGTSDVVDAAVVVSARSGDRIVTGDVADIARMIECANIDVAIVAIG